MNSKKCNGSKLNVICSVGILWLIFFSFQFCQEHGNPSKRKSTYFFWTLFISIKKGMLLLQQQHKQLKNAREQKGTSFYYFCGFLSSCFFLADRTCKSYHFILPSCTYDTTLEVTRDTINVCFRSISSLLIFVNVFFLLFCWLSSMSWMNILRIKFFFFNLRSHTTTATRN